MDANEEGRRQRLKADDGGQKAEGRRQKTEDRRQKTEDNPIDPKYQLLTTDH